ncbi:polysaccharide deacetylase family protein [Bacillus sp. HNG]|uniref:polysaccharide deacetylase family protein n=1 Tax=Bacillus sp. HNG TaxID=2293325 RepID=UPI001676C8EC
MIKGGTFVGRYILLIVLFLSLNQIPAMAKERFDYEKTGKITWEVKTNEKMVAITFDDGPNPVYTPEILDVLSKHKAKATFFVVGKHANNYPEIIRREVLEGHEIANHTFNHLNIIRDSQKLENEIIQTSDALKEITGFSPTLFRPVGGSYNDVIINTAAENGYHVVLWSWHQDTKDWKNPGVNTITKRVISGIKPGNIILFHDSGGNRTQTIRALDRILTKLEKEGYEFVTVSEMLFRTHTTQNN